MGDEVIVSTGPEPRPFPALKALDIDAVARAAVNSYLPLVDTMRADDSMLAERPSEPTE